MGTTPILKLPYPEPTDAVAAGADAIKALAQKLEPPPWINISLVNGWVVSGPTPPQYRRIGDIVYMRGGCAAGSSIIGGILAEYAPVVTAYFIFLVQGGGLGWGTVATNGYVSLNGANNADDQIPHVSWYRPPP